MKHTRLLFLAFLGAGSLADIERRDPEALKVDVIAAQWSWRFEYPAYNVITNELVLPVNQQVLLRMQSVDVVHSFWVPEFRVKQDILPGGKDFVRELRITPNQMGEFKARCAELCGTEHYSMLADVRVVTMEEFETWVEEAAAACEDEAEVCGERWVTNYGCFSCHSTDGETLVGPTWKGLAGSSIELADGSTLVVDDDYLIEAIKDPNAKIRAGFDPNVMPQNFDGTIPEENLIEILAYINSLE